MWEGRPLTREPHWNVASESMSFYNNPITCADKAAVYRDMLSEIHTSLSGQWLQDPA